MSVQDKLFQRFGREMSKGTVIFREGDTGKTMYIIQSGKVRIFKQIGDVDKTLAVLGPGEFFGEMAILDDKPRSASAEVIEDAKMLEVDEGTFEAMIKSNPEIAYRIIKKLSQRLRETNAQIESLLIKDKNRKVVHILKRLANEKGEQIAGGLKINAGVSEVATLCGLSEDETRDVIDKLRKARIISDADGGFVVESIEKLDKFLEYLTMKEQFGDI